MPCFRLPRSASARAWRGSGAHRGAAAFCAAAAVGAALLGALAARGLCAALCDHAQLGAHARGLGAGVGRFHGRSGARRLERAQSARTRGAGRRARAVGCAAARSREPARPRRCRRAAIPARRLGRERAQPAARAGRRSAFALRGRRGAHRARVGAGLVASHGRAVFVRAARGGGCARAARRLAARPFCAGFVCALECFGWHTGTCLATTKRGIIARCWW